MSAPSYNDPANTLLRKIAENTDAGGGLAAAVAQLQTDVAAAESDIATLETSKEDVSNKDTDVNLGNSDTKYPSQLAVKTFALAVEANAHSYTDELTINHSNLTQSS